MCRPVSHIVEVRSAVFRRESEPLRAGNITVDVLIIHVPIRDILITNRLIVDILVIDMLLMELLTIDAVIIDVLVLIVIITSSGFDGVAQEIICSCKSWHLIWRIIYYSRADDAIPGRKRNAASEAISFRGVDACVHFF